MSSQATKAVTANPEKVDDIQKSTRSFSEWVRDRAHSLSRRSQGSFQSADSLPDSDWTDKYSAEEVNAMFRN
jgi:hypothetical protein